VSGISLAPWIAGISGPVYVIAALGLGVGFLRRAWTLLQTPVTVSRAPAKALFSYSIAYLFAIFAALLTDALLAPLLRLGGA
jgi:protoheme IX farnesyltransferase